MKTFLKNLFNTGYKYHPEIVIISCYYNHKKNPYRLKNFNEWYETIKHLEHRIVELSIQGSEFQLPENKFIKRISTDHNLWYKEQLLNIIIKDLPNKYKYVVWMDADVIMENKNWLTDTVKEFENGASVVQPFAHCKHLTLKDNIQKISEKQIEILELGNEDEVKEIAKESLLWNSFGYIYKNDATLHHLGNYDLHGHVGFVWAAELANLKKVGLYEKALTGGADHIIAHATVNQMHEKDITEVYISNIDEVKSYMKNWYRVHGENLSYVKGNLFHLYHGELKKRNYYKRIKEATPQHKKIKKKDKNGLYVPTKKAAETYEEYYNQREVMPDLLVDVVQEPVQNIVVITEFDWGGGDFGGGGAEGSYEIPTGENPEVIQNFS